MTDMGFSFRQLNDTVASIPQGENPYTYVANNLPPMLVVGDAAPTAFNTNMIVAIILYAIAMVAGCFTLFNKYRAGSLWFIKARATSEGSVPLWLPNTTVLFTLWSLCFTVLSIIYMALLVAAQKRVAAPSASQTFMVLIWLPMLYSLWTEFWGMAGALAISHPGKRILGIKVRPWMLNTFALFYFLIAPPALVPDFAYAARTTMRMEDGYSNLSSWLSTQAASWDGSSSFTVDDDLTRIGDKIMQEQENFARFLGHGFTIFMALTIYALVAFAPVAFAYLKLLRRQLASAVPAFSDSQLSARSDRFEALQMSYHVMVIECCLVVLASAIYVALNAWAGLSTVNFLSNGINAIIQHCLFYHTYSLLGVPLCCLIAFRSWKTYREDKNVNERSSGKDSMRKPVVFSTEVHICVDEEDKEKAYGLSTPSLNVQLEGPFNSRV